MKERSNEYPEATTESGNRTQSMINSNGQGCVRGIQESEMSVYQKALQMFLMTTYPYLLSEVWARSVVLGMAQPSGVLNAVIEQFKRGWESEWRKEALDNGFNPINVEASLVGFRGRHI